MLAHWLKALCPRCLHPLDPEARSMRSWITTLSHKFLMFHDEAGEATTGLEPHGAGGESCIYSPLPIGYIAATSGGPFYVPPA